jgi:hypothetical protein
VVVFPNIAGYGLASPSFDIASILTGNNTVFLVFYSNEGTSTFGSVYHHLVSGGVGHYFRLANTAGNARFLSGSTTSLTQANTPYLNQPNIVVGQREGNFLRTFINGAQNGSDVASTLVTIPAASNAQMFLGTVSTSGGSGLSGELAEMIVYNRALTQAERWQVEEYLAVKWIPGV